MEARGRGHVEAQDCSWGKLNLFSDFLQEIAVRALPFRPPQSKSRSLQAQDSLKLVCGLQKRFPFRDAAHS